MHPNQVFEICNVSISLDDFVFPNEKCRMCTTRVIFGLDFTKIPSVFHPLHFQKSQKLELTYAGICPEQCSFSDKNLGPILKRWKGTCAFGEKFAASNCNQKLIGARFFIKGHEASSASFGVPSITMMNDTVEYCSPRDADCHGTHTVYTAVGRYTFQANMGGYTARIAKGVALKERLAVYKVCWKESSWFDSDILFAFDTAVSDGVDVILISIGSGDNVFSPHYLNLIAIGAYSFISKGIFVSSSAGKEGPGSMTVTNLVPWLMTVSAGTIDCSFPAVIILRNGWKTEGILVKSRPKIVCAAFFVREHRII